MQTTEVNTTEVNSSGAWEVVERKKVDSPEPHPRPPTALGMRLRDWLLLIPDYDGCPHTLERFSEAVRYVGGQIGVEAERTLLLALGGKLGGRARVLFGHRLHRHGSLDELLEGLRDSFGDLGAEARLLEELQRSRQKVGESAGEFGARLDKLVTRLRGVYEADRVSGVSLREANKTLVERAALASFRRGLRSAEMEVRVSAYEPRTLDEATRVAVILEKSARSYGEEFRRKRRCR